MLLYDSILIRWLGIFGGLFFVFVCFNFVRLILKFIVFLIVKVRFYDCNKEF